MHVRNLVLLYPWRTSYLGMRLLSTHGEGSTERLRKGLASRGVTVVEFDGYGRGYDVGGGRAWEADVGLVYPSRLVEGGYLDEEQGIPWLNDREDVLLTRNKAACLARLSDEGVPVPDTRLLSSPVEQSVVSDAFDEIQGSVVVKPNSATRGRGVTRVADRESVEGVADYFSVLHESSTVFDRSFLLQEFVDDADDYRVMVVDGEYVGAVRRDGEGWKNNVHRGAEASGVEPPSEVVEMAEAAAEAVEVGFCGVDVLDGARTVVNEVNSRPTVDDPAKYEAGFFDELWQAVKRTYDEDV